MIIDAGVGSKDRENNYDKYQIYSFIPIIKAFINSSLLSFIVFELRLLFLFFTFFFLIFHI